MSIINNNPNIIKNEIRSTELINILSEGAEDLEMGGDLDNFIFFKNELIKEVLIEQNSSIIERIYNSLKGDKKGTVISLFNEALRDLVEYQDFLVQSEGNSTSSNLFLFPIKVKFKKECEQVLLPNGVSREFLEKMKSIFTKYGAINPKYESLFAEKFYYGPISENKAVNLMMYHIKMFLYDLNTMYYRMDASADLNTDFFHVFFIPFILMEDHNPNSPEIPYEQKIDIRGGFSKRMDMSSLLNELKEAFTQDMGYSSLYKKDLIEVHVLKPKPFFSALESSYHILLSDVFDNLLEHVESETNGIRFNKYKVIHHDNKFIIEMTDPDPETLNKVSPDTRFEIEVSRIIPNIDFYDEVHILGDVIEEKGYEFEFLE